MITVSAQLHQLLVRDLIGQVAHMQCLQRHSECCNGLGRVCDPIGQAVITVSVALGLPTWLMRDFIGQIAHVRHLSSHSECCSGLASKAWV